MKKHTDKHAGGESEDTARAVISRGRLSRVVPNTIFRLVRAGRQALSVLLRRRPNRVRGWSAVVPLVLFVAGMLLVTTAQTSRGTELRNDRRIELRELIEERQRELDALRERAGRLREEIDNRTAEQSESDARIAEEQQRAEENYEAAGFTEVHGPGLVVTLNDAPYQPGERPPGATVDDLVVHQQDVQAVVNALWAGGAEAMSIMDVRVISTSAVRCVGNTLLLHGRVYSPPFVIRAIGDSAAMLAALENSPGVRLYQEAADAFGLGYEVTVTDDVTVPAFAEPEGLTHAEAIR